MKIQTNLEDLALEVSDGKFFFKDFKHFSQDISYDSLNVCFFFIYES